MRKENSKPIISFDSPEEIKKFMSEYESNIYMGKNIDGQDVIVELEKEKSMIVKTLNSKNWWEWVEYDESGFIVAQGFEPSKKLEEKIEENHDIVDDIFE